MKTRPLFPYLLLGALLLAMGPSAARNGALPQGGRPLAGREPAQSCRARLNDAPADYPSVQAAVDASTHPTDVVKVAGHCAGVEQRAGLTQTVYLSKTLTLQGGYTFTNWTDPDPLLHPTMLDALGAGRALLVVGNVTPTLAGLRFTGGDALRAGADPYGQGRGGGLYLWGAVAEISGCLFYSNTADSGGGIYTYDSLLTMRGSTLTANAAPFFGGGMLMYGGAGRLEGNLFFSNTAGMGAGAYFGSDALTLTNNAFLSNTALYEGGGLIVEIYGGNSELVGNEVVGNRAYFNGGGLYFGEEVRGGSGRAGDAPDPRIEPCCGAGLYPVVGPASYASLLGCYNCAQSGSRGELAWSGIASAGSPARSCAEGPGDCKSPGGVQGQSPGKEILDAPSRGAAAKPLLFAGNLIAHNWTAGHGGGVYMGGDGGAAELVGNMVQENTAGGDGGGIYLDNSADPTPILSNTVSGNTAGGDGGGIYLATTTATVRGNVVQGNLAGGNGGGGHGRGVWSGNTFSGNESMGSGGGLYGGGTLARNAVVSNGARYGGGIYLSPGPTVIVENTVRSNTAAEGGGLYLTAGPVTLTANLIASNDGGKRGGGAYLDQSTAIVQSNVIASNEANDGGGLFLDGYLSGQDDALLVNNWIVDNRSWGYGGGGLHVEDFALSRLSHNTLARNTGDAGIFLRGNTGRWSTVVLTDTILVSHTVGLYVESGNTARLEATLWGNDADWAGDGAIVTGTVNLWGPPAFLDPADGDYHIGALSAALDAGVDAGVYADIDGEPRPLGAGYDIGADEAGARLALAKYAVPDPVAAGSLLTYTLLLTNSGVISLHAVLSETLPAHVTPTGVLTWSAALAPGGAWTREVVVAVEEGYAGPLVNTAAVTTVEGLAGRAAVTVTAVVPILGLAAWNDGPTVLGAWTTLTATIAAGTGVTYTWALGDGAVVHGPCVLTYTYPAAGLYTAVVTASNAVSAAAAGTVVAIVPELGWRIYVPLVVRGLSRQ